MTTLAQLARDCAPQLARYMPAKPAKIKRTAAPGYQMVWQRNKRRAFYDNGLTHLGTKRKLNRLPKPAPIFFTELGEKLGITESAARCRYYRKQIPANVLREVGK